MAREREGQGEGEGEEEEEGKPEKVKGEGKGWEGKQSNKTGAIARGREVVMKRTTSPGALAVRHVSE